MNQNYDKIMQAAIKENEGKKLLLHSCCAPCSSACLERLEKHFDLTVFYYNPNIDGIEEYRKRAAEQKRLCEVKGISFIDEGYSSDEFYSFVRGYENEKEGGLRCEKCFYLRLKKTALKAKAEGFDFFATTLTVSPQKNSQTINRIGERIQNETGVSYLPSDFKKQGGYLRSIELSREYGLYRQDYCGCVFSKIEREKAKKEKSI